MSSPSVYRKVCWKIDNVVKEVVFRYSKSKSISKGFSVLLPENKTQWLLEFYPNSEYCDFYIFKTRSEQDNYVIKARLYVKKSDENLQFIDEIKAKSSELDLNEGFIFGNMFKPKELFLESRNLIADECLTFIVEFEIHQITTDAEAKCISSEALLSVPEYEKILMCDQLSDFSLVCSDLEELPVHRLIIALKCPILMQMLDAEITEHKFSQLKFNDIDSQTMKAFLRYLYTGNLDMDQGISTKLLYVAEKFQMHHLRSICISLLNENITLSNVMETLVAADHYNEKILEENCIGFIKMKLDELEDFDCWGKLSMRHALKIMFSLDKCPATIHLRGSL